MNLQEICKKLNLSETTLITSFQRTKTNLEKRGILLIKKGQGKKAELKMKFRMRNLTVTEQTDFRTTLISASDSLRANHF